MKKSDESNSRLQEDSSVAVHGLRRFNMRQETPLTNSNVSRSMYQNDNILDSWHNADEVGATYFWNHDDMERTKNDISLLRGVITNSYAGVEPGDSMSSAEANHRRVSGGASQQLQKIVPCGYAPNRFPVTVTSTSRPCWPKTCYGNSAYTFSGTITLPSAIIPGSLSVTQPAPSTSYFGISSVNEQIVCPKSPSASNASSDKKSQTLLTSLLRQFENGTNTSRILQM